MKPMYFLLVLLRRHVWLWILLLICVGLFNFTPWSAWSSRAQDNTPTPPLVTLVPPTAMPSLPPPTATPLPSKSAIARIRERLSRIGTPLLYVGIPYNIPPFAHITETGSIEGFEASIARAIAEDWGAEIEFKQVTSQNALTMLLSGEIDLLIGKQVVTRDVQSLIDFSTPYFANRQVALALVDAPQADIKDLNGQTVGVVSGSAAERAFNTWAEGNGIQANVNRYLMIDEGLRALADKQIVALLADRWELDQRVGGGKVQGIKLLNGTFRVEPYGIAMVRYDASLRTMVNRTLQRLVSSNRLEDIFKQWFPTDLDPADKLLPMVWRGVDSDQRTIKDFEGDIVYVQVSIAERIRNKQPLRVAGLGEPPGPNGQPSPLEAFNRAMIDEMTRRWGVTVEALPNSYGQGVDLVANGQADIAVGQPAQWEGVDRIEFAGIYAQRGYRMLVREASTMESFSGFLEGRREIGIFSDDLDAYEIAKKLAVSVGIAEETLKRVVYNNEQEAVEAVFNNNVRILFGDAFRIARLAQANDAKVTLVPKLYEPRPIGFGIPRNDVDFRELVDVTLQEMARDGTYQRLWQTYFNVGDPLAVVQWPGTPTMFGINTR